VLLPGKASSPADLLHERWLEMDDTARTCRCRCRSTLSRSARLGLAHAGPWPQRDNRSWPGRQPGGLARSPTPPTAATARARAGGSARRSVSVSSHRIASHALRHARSDPARTYGWTRPAGAPPGRRPPCAPTYHAFACHHLHGSKPTHLFPGSVSTLYA
jgi:hypothetical protein